MTKSAVTPQRWILSSFLHMKSEATINQLYSRIPKQVDDSALFITISYVEKSKSPEAP